MSQSANLPIAVPHQAVTAPGAEVNAQAHLFASLASGMATATLVQVRAVGSGTVDVQPMVGQADGAGNVVPHGIINGLPVFIYQGGSCAVVLTPAVGDIGVAVFASRDISVVKERRMPSQPGSSRRYDWADGMYMGGFLNAAATTHVTLTPGTVTIVAPTSVVINSPSVQITGASLTHNGVNVGSTHVHGGVQTGVSDTLVPH